MDAIVGLLDGPRARGAFLLRALMDPPWSVRVQDEAPLSLLAMVRGDAWVVPDRPSETVHLGPGEVAITRGPDPCTFADDPATPPQVVIHPGERCTTPDGQDLAQAMDLGVRTWGNSPDGSTVKPLRPQHRLQTGPRCQPAAAPGGGAVGVMAISIWG